MQIIPAQDLQSSSSSIDQLVDTLANDGIVCFPSGSSYRLATRLQSESAVIKFLQVKRRTRKAPALIFVHDSSALRDLVDEIPEEAQILMETFWPGPLTIQMRLGSQLPKKIVRNLNKSKKVGFRIPEDPIAQQLLHGLQEPLLISSANIANKKGAHSEAQIRKNFGRDVQVLISAGDLSPQGCSTVVDISSQTPVVERPGNIEESHILQVYQSQFDTLSAANVSPVAAAI